MKFILIIDDLKVGEVDAMLGDRKKRTSFKNRHIMTEFWRLLVLKVLFIWHKFRVVYQALFAWLREEE